MNEKEDSVLFVVEALKIEDGKYITIQAYQSLVKKNVELNAMLKKKNNDVLEFIDELSDLVGTVHGITTSSLSDREMRKKMLDYITEQVDK
jgi:hypothetical protein